MHDEQLVFAEDWHPYRKGDSPRPELGKGVIHALVRRGVLVVKTKNKRVGRAGRNKAAVGGGG